MLKRCLTQALVLSPILLSGALAADEFEGLKVAGCFAFAAGAQVALAPNCNPDELNDVPDESPENRFLRRLLKEQSNYFSDPENWSSPITFCTDDQLMNALSFPRSERSGGRLVLGRPFMMTLFTTGYNYQGPVDVAKEQVARKTMLAVLAHEFAHQVQFDVLQREFPLYVPKSPAKGAVRSGELEADAIAAAFLKDRYQFSKNDFDAVLHVYSQLPGCDYTHPQFHGHIPHRLWAITTGMRIVTNGLKMDVLRRIHEEVYVKGPPTNEWVSISAQTGAKARVLAAVDALLETASSASPFAPSSSVKENFQILSFAPGETPESIAPIAILSDSAWKIDDPGVFASFSSSNLSVIRELWSTALTNGASVPEAKKEIRERLLAVRDRIDKVRIYDSEEGLQTALKERVSSAVDALRTKGFEWDSSLKLVSAGTETAEYKHGTIVGDTAVIDLVRGGETNVVVVKSGAVAYEVGGAWASAATAQPANAINLTPAMDAGVVAMTAVNWERVGDTYFADLPPHATKEILGTAVGLTGTVQIKFVDGDIHGFDITSRGAVGSAARHKSVMIRSIEEEKFKIPEGALAYLE